MRQPTTYDKIVKSHDAMPVSHCAIPQIDKGIVRFQISTSNLLLGQTLQFASVQSSYIFEANYIMRPKNFLSIYFSG